MIKLLSLTALTIALEFLPLSAAFAEMRLRSPDFVDGGPLGLEHVMAGFGCAGGNSSPALTWDGVPEGTASFVVTAYDPDAPSGSGIWHWSVFNLPAATRSLPEDAGAMDGGRLPDKAVQARNDLSQNAFTGACPPVGAKPHRYIFTVFALPKETLPLDETTSAALVGFYAHSLALDSATLTAVYGRP